MQAAVARLSADMGERQSDYPSRAGLQHARLKLLPFPTTTIGSFPQTAEIRRIRIEYRAGRLDEAAYREAMKVEWTIYAQSLTDRPMKGMLTGPVTILNRSFVRDDQPRAASCRQLALAMRQEVLDLEKAGVRLIQIDEAALREALPLRQSQWQAYLDWAIECFCITANGVGDVTQIHTHMCYWEFNDIIASIAGMGADVITIETSHSDMELLDVFKDFEYPNEIGPGVYDIHSPTIPSQGEMVALMKRAAERIPPQRLWVNPDCGLKTRQRNEVTPSLAHMVEAARQLCVSLV